MAKSRKGNRYKRWFFLLLAINLFYVASQLYITPNFLNHLKKYYNQWFQAPVIPSGDYVYGFDVSEYQGIINWNSIDQINEGHSAEFVIIRSTAGKDYRDRYFTSNFREAKKNGIIRGAYHYYRPNENSTSQARNYIKNVKLSPGDFPPILDIEKVSKVQSIKSLKIGIKNWLSIVESHYGIKPIIYTGAHYYNDHLKGEFSDYVLWIANYNNVKTPLKNSTWSIWQFSDNGSIDGIKGPVDLNLFNGSRVDLKKYLLK